MQIRLATVNDAQDIYRIHMSAVKTVCGDFYTEKEITAWLRTRSPEGYHEGIKKGEMYIAEYNGKTVGFGHAIPGEIVAIFVDPSSHKKGVGTLLLNHGLEIASIDHEKVKVESTVNAEGFYKKHGFVKVKNDTVKINDVDIQIVIMEFHS